MIKFVNDVVHHVLGAVGGDWTYDMTPYVRDVLVRDGATRPADHLRRIVDGRLFDWLSMDFIIVIIGQMAGFFFTWLTTS